jgi:hypothetical protein
MDIGIAYPSSLILESRIRNPGSAILDPNPASAIPNLGAGSQTSNLQPELERFFGL